MNVRLKDEEMAEVKEHAARMKVSPRDWLAFTIRRVLEHMREPKR